MRALLGSAAEARPRPSAALGPRHGKGLKPNARKPKATARRIALAVAQGGGQETESPKKNEDVGGSDVVGMMLAANESTEVIRYLAAPLPAATVPTAAAASGEENAEVPRASEGAAQQNFGRVLRSASRSAQVKSTVLAAVGAAVCSFGITFLATGADPTSRRMAAAAARSAAVSSSVATAETRERSANTKDLLRRAAPPASVAAALEPTAGAAAGAASAQQQRQQGGPGHPRMLLGHFRMPEARVADLLPVGESAKVLLKRSAAISFAAMRHAAAQDGVPIFPVSGFRSVSEQEEVYFGLNAAKKGESVTERALQVAPPGYSEHHTGYAVDIGASKSAALTEAFEGTKQFKWLQRNAERFGFELSFPRGSRQGVAYEPWHWRFIGDSESWAIFAPARAFAAGGAVDARGERTGAEEEHAVGQENVMLIAHSSVRQGNSAYAVAVHDGLPVYSS